MSGGKQLRISAQGCSLISALNECELERVPLNVRLGELTTSIHKSHMVQ